MKFFDTCALLDLQQNAFESKFLISSITLSELELIKTSGTKDEDTKWAARKVLHLLIENEDKYEVVFPHDFDDFISKFNLPKSDDSRIICSAYQYWTEVNDVTFVTSDLSCKALASAIGLPTEFALIEDTDEYTGYKEVCMGDNELADFYGRISMDNENVYDLKINEYLLITDSSNQVIDEYKWTEEGYRKVPFCKTESQMFGKVTAFENDPYQKIALDSLINNQITMLRGPAGSGKSYLAFSHMFSMLDHGEIDKIIIFCNTVATKGSAKLGFYPGSRTEKLLDSQIGNLLESKLGDRVEVERLISNGRLVLLPMSDIRGYDTSGMHAAIYISEAQNLDIELMRLALQRIGEDSRCIIDGDYTHQVDMSMYAGNHNGMRRVSQVFRGESFYGEVELKTIHRSRIAQVAEKM